MAWKIEYTWYALVDREGRIQKLGDFDTEERAKEALHRYRSRYGNAAGLIVGTLNQFQKGIEQ